KSPDAVLIVHHQVAGGECQRVNGVAPFGGQPLAVDGSGPAAGQIGFGDDDQVGAGYDHAAVQRTLEHPDNTAFGSGPRVQHGGRGVGFGQPLHDTVGGAGSRSNDHAVPAGQDMGAKHREDALDVVLM